MRDYYYRKWYYSDTKTRSSLDILIASRWNVYDCQILVQIDTYLQIRIKFYKAVVNHVN